MQTLGGNAVGYTQCRQCADPLLGVLCAGCVRVGDVHASDNSDSNIVYDTYEVDAQTLQECIATQALRTVVPLYIAERTGAVKHMSRPSRNALGKHTLTASTTMNTARPQERNVEDTKKKGNTPGCR